MVAPGTDTPFAFGQQVVFAHDGEPFVSYESRTWLLDDDGGVTGPGPRETGFWRPQPDGTLEVLIAHSTGLVTPFYGRSRNLTSWEMETWALVRTETAPTVERSTRLYGVVRGDLAYVDEREHVEHGMAPVRVRAAEPDRGLSAPALPQPDRAGDAGATCVASARFASPSSAGSGAVSASAVVGGGRARATTPPASPPPARTPPRAPGSSGPAAPSARGPLGPGVLGPCRPSALRRPAAPSTRSGRPAS